MSVYSAFVHVYLCNCYFNICVFVYMCEFALLVCESASCVCEYVFGTDRVSESVPYVCVWDISMHVCTICVHLCVVCWYVAHSPFPVCFPFAA